MKCANLYSALMTCAVAFAAALFFMSFSPSAAKAATAVAKGPYSWTDPHGVSHETAYITIGDTIVFCIDPGKPAPYGGHSYGTPKRQYDDGVKAILYYGFGGDGNEIGKTMKDMVKTYVALNNWLDGKRDQKTYSNQDPDVWKLIQHAKKGDAPSYQVSFSKKSVTSSISGNEQKSETIKLNGNGTVTLKIPAKVTIHVSGKSQKGGKITIKDGQSFYFTAPLDYESDYVTGNVNGEINQLASLLYLPSSNSYQRLMSSSFVVDPVVEAGFKVHFEKRQQKITVYHKDKDDKTLLKKTVETKNIGSKYKYTPEKKIVKDGKTYIPVSNEKKEGTLGNKDVTITFYYKLERTITVLHKDNRDGTLLKKEVYTKYRGDTYSYSPAKNLKKGDYTYRPVTNKKVTGTVGKENITITFYYDVPLIKVNLDKLQIYTALAKDGLPVKLNLAKKNIYKDNTAGMDSTKIKIGLYQGDSLIVSKEYTAKSLPNKINMKIPPAGLKVNENKPYTAKLEGFNKNDVDVSKDASQLTTHGFTSSEEDIKINAVKDRSFKQKNVIMTEITPKTDEKRFYEIFNISTTAIPAMKTGYGFEQKFNFSYTNDLGNAFNDDPFSLYVPSALIDSYLEYPVANKKAKITYDQMTREESDLGEAKVTTIDYELPQVLVEKETGNLFSVEQKDKKDKHIKNGLIDGGRKFYLPVWMDLGKYQVKTETPKLGVQQLKLHISNEIDVKAYMYATMDSDTVENDEILLQPVNGKNPFPDGLPDGWTKDDLKWIEQR
ncbi:MucBP domain-containing protein [Bacillus subtilis]